MSDLDSVAILRTSQVHVHHTGLTAPAVLVAPRLLVLSPPSRLSSATRAPRHTPRALDLIDSNSNVSDIRARPLPPIPPTPQSAPPAPHRQISPGSPLRPLPSVPETDVRLSVTPATPLPPPTPITESNALLAPGPRQGPPRFTSLSLHLQTSPDALQPRVVEPLPSSPLSPIIPEVPSPRTAHRKRISKLRRHLGQSVQFHFDRPGTARGEVQSIEEEDSEDLYSDVAFKRTSSELGSSVDSDSDSSSDGGDDDHRFRKPADNRTSQKWVRERGGTRWTEQDFSNILRDLRAL
ncbi:hypothetical protein C8J57DRAFT_1218182 [Mycena rebaudengoi]|nr:hypothetical protein C8J57DRAFT_1218182 [Mycena rebaudengoi]